MCHVGSPPVVPSARGRGRCRSRRGGSAPSRGRCCRGRRAGGRPCRPRRRAVGDAGLAEELLDLLGACEREGLVAVPLRLRLLILSESVWPSTVTRLPGYDSAISLPSPTTAFTADVLSRHARAAGAEGVLEDDARRAADRPARCARRRRRRSRGTGRAARWRSVRKASRLGLPARTGATSALQVDRAILRSSVGLLRLGLRELRLQHHRLRSGRPGCRWRASAPPRARPALGDLGLGRVVLSGLAE